MATKDSLGDRMKAFYEDRCRISIPRRTNVLIRIDGKSFHTYTKKLKRPYDEDLSLDMTETTKFLCESIQGARIGYVQSDEISILITDYDDITTHGWFDNNVQKMCSISASIATAKFNELRNKRYIENVFNDNHIKSGNPYALVEDSSILKNWPKQAQFDARVFSIPEPEEVVNYFLWRQQDATRNSISMAAQALFSHKELQGMSSNQMQEKMFTEKGVNWNDYPTRFKRGGAVVKVEKYFRGKDFKFKDDGKTYPIDPEQIIIRKTWESVETPIFSADRNFILNRIKKS